MDTDHHLLIATWASVGEDKQEGGSFQSRPRSYFKPRQGLTWVVADVLVVGKSEEDSSGLGDSTLSDQPPGRLGRPKRTD